MDSMSILSPQTIIPSNQVDSSGKSAEDLAADRAEKQKLDFLELLLTQLQNQNPLDPLDTNEYTAQLTRYSQLEQQIETNEKLTVTNDILKTSANTNLTYIGQNVEVGTNLNVLQNGEAKWSYAAKGGVDDVVLTFYDDKNTVLYETSGSIAPGVHDFTLNAAEAGITLADGQVVRLAITALKDDNAVETDTTSHMKIDGLWTDNNQSYLTAGDLSLRTDDILKISDFGSGSEDSNGGNDA